MKKIITMFMLLSSVVGFSQREVAKKITALLAEKATFKSYSVLTATPSKKDADADKIVSNASYALINKQNLSSLMASKDAYIEIDVPYQNETITVQLYQVDIFAEGFHIDTDKTKSEPYHPGLYYRGIIKGDTNSLVAFNFFNEELSGVISNQKLANVVIGKLDKKNNTTDYIIYSDSQMKVPNSFKCAVKESEEAPKSISNSAPSSAKWVTFYFEVDYDLYVQNNSDTVTTTNWMTSVFNNVQTIYTNDGITTSLKSMFIWTTEDPYSIAFDGTASSSDYLYKFNDLRPVFDGDIGQLVGIDEGGLGGVAVGINGLCTQDNYSYADVGFSYNAVPTFSWTIEVITHEFGHLMGSPHTHACVWNGDNTSIDGCGPTANSNYTEGSCDIGPIPDAAVKGTIMSYCHLLNNIGISFSNGFGPQPAARILSRIGAGTCLSSDGINTCINTVTNISATSPTATSSTITWDDLGGATSWEVSVTPFGSSDTTWVTVNVNTYTATGLSANTYYIVRVRPICGFGLLAPNEQRIAVTSTNYCDGIQITDTGGLTGDYTDSETYVRTIIPNLPNKKIALTFSAFDLELDYDYLYVYDGNSTSAPDLSNGGFTGNTEIPGPFVSTAADGSLTIKFSSDGGVVAAGYVADILCENSLSNTTFEPNIDFTYSPNPTNGMVNIMSKTKIEEVSVYNIEGRLLYQREANALDAKVDMSAFATGSYFFKLKFENKEANFKVLKM